MMICSLFVIVMAVEMIVDVVGLLLIDLSQDEFSGWRFLRRNAIEFFVEFKDNLKFSAQEIFS